MARQVGATTCDVRLRPAAKSAELIWFRRTELVAELVPDAHWYEDPLEKRVEKPKLSNADQRDDRKPGQTDP
jgi:hypothetical protein